MKLLTLLRLLTEKELTIATLNSKTNLSKKFSTTPTASQISKEQGTVFYIVSTKTIPTRSKMRKIKVSPINCGVVDPPQFMGETLIN